MLELTKKRKIIILSVVGVVVLSVGAFVVWALSPFQADADRSEAVKTNGKLVYHETGESITLMSNVRQGKKGILLYPGARIEAAAYMAPYASFVQETGTVLVIAKPLLNLAIFDMRNPDRYTRGLPMVKEWYVAGHSLGGVKACNVVGANPKAYVGLILLGSYCSNRIDDETAVLSISGSEDGLTTPSKIKKSTGNLPDDAEFIEIKGMIHSQFGDYGEQSGDGESTISQFTAWYDLKEDLKTFID